MAETLLRRSALEAFACPWNYLHSYELGVEDTSDPALRGIGFHEFANGYVARLAAKRLSRDYEEARAALADALVGCKLPTHLMAEVEAIALRFAERWDLDVDAYLAAEEQMQDEEYECRFDVAYARDQELEIEDWKTYYVGMTEAEAKQLFQARFYIWMARKVFPGFPRYRFTLNFVRLGWRTSVVFEPAEIEAFEPLVHATAENIRACRREEAALIARGVPEAEARGQAWPAVPGLHCGFCALACPKMDDARRLPVRVQSDDEARAALGELLILDRAYAARQAALRAWATEHGAVELNGSRAEFVGFTERRFPVRPVLDVLEEHGITELPGAMTLSSTALATYLKTKKHAAIAPDLLAVAAERPRTRFEVRKAKPEPEGGAIDQVDTLD